MSKYIIRFDDVSPAMDWNKFIPLKKVLEELGIKVILGVVPNNLDPKLIVGKECSDFFYKIQKWKAYGDTIAQHGYTHVYDSECSGILGINKRSEFSGHSFEEQYNILKKGKEILVKYGVWEPYFMAPAHSFDKNTLKALKSLGFNALTDGYGFYPYKMEGICLVPQLASYPIDIGFGIHTLCIHINTMNQEQIDKLEKFIFLNKNKFYDFKNIINDPINTSLKSYFFRKLTYILLKFKRSLV